MMATMHAMPTQMDIYEQIGVLSARMVDAARANDWDHLVMLEHDVRQLREQLTDNTELDPAPVDIERKRSLIQQILDDDAEVRRHTEPWMEQVRRFLGAGAQRRRVERAYQAAG